MTIHPSKTTPVTIIDILMNGDAYRDGLSYNSTNLTNSASEHHVSIIPILPLMDDREDVVSERDKTYGLEIMNIYVITWSLGQGFEGSLMYCSEGQWSDGSANA